MAFPLRPIIPSDTERWRSSSAAAAEFTSPRHAIHVRVCHPSARRFRDRGSSPPPPAPHPAPARTSPRPQPAHTRSQQAEGQLRGDFNLSGKIHIKPLTAAFTTPASAALPPWHPSLPSSSSSPHPPPSCHLIQISELAGAFVCASIFACQTAGRRRAGVQAGVFMRASSDGGRQKKGAKFWRVKQQRRGDFHPSNACEVSPSRPGHGGEGDGELTSRPQTPEAVKAFGAQRGAARLRS